jgi:hypothetical protein
MQLIINERLHAGTPLEIVEQMKSLAFGGDDETVAQYVDRVATTMIGDPNAAAGDTDEVKCETLLRSMIKNGLAAEADKPQPQPSTK